MVSEDSKIISVDYTDLFRHRSRSYTFDDIAIPVGVDWVGFAWGAAAGAAVAVGSAVCLSLVGFPWWIGVMLGVAAAGAVYAMVSTDSRGKVSPVERLFLFLDYHLRQPRRFDGTGSDDEPTYLHLQVLLWRPGWMPESDNDFPEPALYGIRVVER
ncbi:hypothetical protein [Nocardia sp. NPDC052566]|uniref:hypothetical protein n=1 Tax=Nocardia sp. NPDC052566 TaxID=3364330 RepID=UPI0037C88839